MNPTRSFRLGYSNLAWGRTPDLDKVLGTIADAGWEGMEFINISLDWLGTTKRLRSLLDKHGLPPVCMFGDVSLGADADQVLERQKRLIEYAAELGCAIYCFVGASREKESVPTEDEFKRLAERSEMLIDYAEPYGLVVAYHAHPACTVESEAEQDKLLSYTDRLQVCVDVSVAAFMDEDAIAQLHKYRERLGYVHVKDVTEDWFCVMGEGTGRLDFGRIRETLNEIGYEGWVVGEHPGSAESEANESCYANREFLRSVGY